MLVPKMFLHAALKFVLPEVMKLIQPLQEYKDLPNDADKKIDKIEGFLKKVDSRFEALERLAHPQKDWTDEIAALANNVQKDLANNVENMNNYRAEIHKILAGIENRMGDYEPRNIKLEALMDKFDRDVSYMDHNLQLIKQALNFKGKDA